MNTARILKEEIVLVQRESDKSVSHLRDLELPSNTDEITVKAICYDSESKRKESQKRGK